jgi:hypothetical protein
MGGATSLTQMQLLGVGSGTNVAEGYPRFALTETQREIVERFPAFLAEAIATPFPVLEARAHHAFFDALGQRSAPIGTGRILSYYASSVAIDVVGGCLARVTSKVAVITPVLDCIPALFRHRGLQLEALTEGRLVSADPLGGLDGIGAVVVASPNNPTGTVLTAPQMRRLAEACAERDVIRHGSRRIEPPCGKSWTGVNSRPLRTVTLAPACRGSAWRRGWPARACGASCFGWMSMPCHVGRSTGPGRARASAICGSPWRERPM